MIDLLANVYQFLFESTGSDLAPVLVFAVILVLLGLGVGYLVTTLLGRLRPAPPSNCES